jgi:acetoin utilization deacetylase AcuC-like enzyme
MSVLFCADERFREHDTGPGHPERPARIDAAREGVLAHGLGELLVPISPREATEEELLRVHDASHLRRVERFCELGGGHLDADTVVGYRSAELARLAAGGALEAIELLRGGTASGAFVAVRPPGHHATADRAMGFCIYNHVAVVAADLAERGERVAVVDFDAHHGNGTQDIFYERGDVVYVSWHQSPHYPYTGQLAESGSGAGLGTTMNIPLPPGATGDHYRRSLDELVLPLLAEHAVEWLVLSAGFDAHRADPLCDLALTSGDVGDVVAELVGVVGPGRTLALLEGGYDLQAVAECSAATVAALGGVALHPEAPTSGGPGARFVDAAIEARARLM